MFAYFTCKFLILTLKCSWIICQLMCKFLQCYKKQCQGYEILNFKNQWVKICMLTWRVFAESITNLLLQLSHNFSLRWDVTSCVNNTLDWCARASRSLTHGCLDIAIWLYYIIRWFGIGSNKHSNLLTFTLLTLFNGWCTISGLLR